MKDDSHHRELCLRQHRLFAFEALLQAWLNQLDAVVVMRADLAKFLGLSRFKRVRIDWFRDDAKSFFPYQEAFFDSNQPDSLHSIVLSRVSLATLPTSSLSVQERVKLSRYIGIRIELLCNLETFDGKESESDRYTFVTLLAAGLTDLPKCQKPYETRLEEDVGNGVT